MQACHSHHPTIPRPLILAPFHPLDPTLIIQSHGPPLCPILGDRYWQNTYLEGVSDITLRLDGRSPSTVPLSSLLVSISFVCRWPLVWDRAVRKTCKVLEGNQLLCTASSAKIKGDEVEVFSSHCQSRFKVLSGVQEVMDLFRGTAVSEEVGHEPPIIEVFSSGKEGLKLRINHVEHGSDRTR